MSKRKIEAVVEDPKRRLLDVCRHTAPACWACVAKDMERQRDEAETEVAKLTAQRTMTVHRLGGAVEGAPTHAGNFLQRIDALRAIEADSGERVRALEEALSDLVRFQPEEGRANRSHYAEHGMLCLAAYDGTGACDCGWTEWKAAEDLARRALSPQGDASLPSTDAPDTKEPTT